VARYSANCSGCGKPIGSGHTRWCPVRRRLAAGLAVAALLLCVGRAAAQAQDTVKLEVAGGGARVVQVDQVTIQKVDRTLVTSFPFQVSAPKGFALYFWTYPANVVATEIGEGVLEVTAAPKGDLTVSLKCVGADWDAKKFITKYGRTTFSVGEVQPGPVPVPPDPKPVPPDPKPGVVKSLKVLVVFETSGLTKLHKDNPGQWLALYAKPVRDYLNARCAKEPDGLPASRFYDKDTDTSKEPRGWAALLSRPRTSVPWIIICDGETPVFEGALPNGVEETLKLLKTYGGV
jgi:hypothetical protein